jgi:hypothetical protein
MRQPPRVTHTFPRARERGAGCGMLAVAGGQSDHFDHKTDRAKYNRPCTYSLRAPGLRRGAPFAFSPAPTACPHRRTASPPISESSTWIVARGDGRAYGAPCRDIQLNPSSRPDRRAGAAKLQQHIPHPRLPHKAQRIHRFRGDRTQPLAVRRSPDPRLPRTLARP